jgi:Ca2+-binding RTX toxin-like protein
MDGGANNDTLYGDDGGDRLSGGSGRDELHGGQGRDRLFGDEGADKLFGSNGADRMTGGKGADEINLWEEMKAGDTIVFRPGDSGSARGDADVVNSFQRGSDKIELVGFGDIKLMRGDDFRGGGNASCRFVSDGEDSRLVIDVDGDLQTDMTIFLPWLDGLSSKDFIFG